MGDHRATRQAMECGGGKALTDHLARREVEKDARRPINEEARLTFLGETAYWLWTKRGGATSFHAAEVPKKLIDALPGDAAMDRDSKMREYLAGAFLDRKSGDIYYFPHRSFAEFIVARMMTRSNPRGLDHQNYSDLFVDGVKEFLLQAPDKNLVASWLDSFCESLVSVQISYTDFLIQRYRECGREISAFQQSHWYPLLLWTQAQPGDRSNELRTLLKSASSLQLLITLQLWGINAVLENEDAEQESVYMLATLLERQFNLVYDRTNKGRIVVNGPDAELIKAILAASTRIRRNSVGDRELTFSRKKLIQSVSILLAAERVDIHADELLAGIRDEEYAFGASTLASMLSPLTRADFISFLKHADSFSSIVVEKKERLQGPRVRSRSPR